MQRAYNLFFGKRKTNEDTHLLLSEVKIVVSEIPQTNLTLEDMPDDVITHLSGFLSYNKDLFHLRMTSTTMHKIVENTPAGLLARQALNIKDCGGMTYIVTTLGGGMGLVGMSLLYGSQTLIKNYVENPYLYAGAMLFSITGSLTIGGCAGAAVSALASYHIPFVSNRFNLFHQIRHDLEKPVNVSNLKLTGPSERLRASNIRLK